MVGPLMVWLVLLSSACVDTEIHVRNPFSFWGPIYSPHSASVACRRYETKSLRGNTPICPPFHRACLAFFLLTVSGVVYEPSSRPFHVPTDFFPCHYFFRFCKKGSLTVKSAAFDSKLGGRDMDWAIAQHAAEEFKKKTGNVRNPFTVDPCLELR